MKLIKWWLRRRGLVIVPMPPSAKMLREQANIGEHYHPSGRGRTVLWLREVADQLDGRTPW